MAKTPFAINDLWGGEQRVYKFANGWGASVVRHIYSYGGPEGLFELAVRDSAGHLDYTSGITDNVLGYLTEAQVQEYLAQIEALPERAVMMQNEGDCGPATTGATGVEAPRYKVVSGQVTHPLRPGIMGQVARWPTGVYTLVVGSTHYSVPQAWATAQAAPPPPLDELWRWVRRNGMRPAPPPPLDELDNCDALGHDVTTCPCYIAGLEEQRRPV